MLVASGAVLQRWSTLPDAEIVQQVLAGHTALFEILMRRHNERLYRAARAILRDDREAEDAIQQAYLNAYAQLRQFDNRAAFATWLTRIAVNESIARARTRGRYQPRDDGADTVEAVMDTRALDPERLAYSREIARMLEQAVDALPDGAREVFVLRQIEGLSTAETAASLGVSEDVVKTRFSRARARLRDELESQAGIAAGQAFTFLRPRCDRLVAAVMAQLA